MTLPADASFSSNVLLPLLTFAVGGKCLGWSVEQAADGRVSVRIAGGDADAVARALHVLLGRPLTLERFERPSDLGEGKPRRYRSAPA
ncbi:hypothetical protein [Microbacterium sp. zg.Y909]|uniref:hypothetical protein n=1 Tax=Microbacterium sp. zg.Y909 TaxID=2969413 RepID=UPI00214CFD70|nr:hypothetical protein [Microbacterium sp. zg.Y909]MCR2828181.1 hypothetical protein [Microbacterium sp. zg.Y909]